MDLIRSQYAVSSDSEDDGESEPSALTLTVTTAVEDSDSDQDKEVELVGECKNTLSASFLHAQIKQEPISDDSGSESDSASLDSSDISDHDDEKTKAKKRQPPKARGELYLLDLPPIEDLHISVPHEQCQAVGFIKSIVDTLVIVEAYPLTPPMDIDSVLFLAEGDQALGHIFDVFGPVRHPHYCVRFNSKDHMEARGVKIGELVYCAPSTPHTSYLLMARLERLRGTDASWKDDHETPIDQLEFSDDEAEAAARRSNGASGSVGRGIRKMIRPWRSRPPHPSNFHRNMNPYNVGVQDHGQNPYIPLNVAGFAPPRQQFYGGFNGRSYQRGFQHQYPRPPRPPVYNWAYAPHYASPGCNYGPPPPPPPPPPIQPYPHSFQQFQYPRAPPPPPPSMP